MTPEPQFRYFRDADGTRWKVSTLEDGENFYLDPRIHSSWAHSSVRLSAILHPKSMRRDGTVETDASGTALATPAAGSILRELDEKLAGTTDVELVADFKEKGCEVEPVAGGAGDAWTHEDFRCPECNHWLGNERIPSGEFNCAHCKHRWTQPTEPGESRTAEHQRDILRAIVDGMEFEKVDEFLQRASVDAGKLLGVLAKIAHSATADERDAIKKELADARAEAERLEEWKASALQVESEWSPQAVGKLLGLPLGRSIRAAIEPGIVELQQTAAGLKAALEGIKVRCQDASRELIGVHGMDMHKQRLALIYDAIEQALIPAGAGEEKNTQP